MDESDVDSAHEEEEEEDEVGEKDAEEDDRIERDPATNEVTGFRVDNEFVDTKEPYVVRRFSTVLVQSEAETDPYKFVGLVRQFVRLEDGSLGVDIRWFYRFHDLPKQAAAELVVRRARLSGGKLGAAGLKKGGKGGKAGADSGMLKEVYFSDHTDLIPVESIMHPVRVWCLPDDSLDPVSLPPSPSAPAAPAAHPHLLPGFLCRRLVLAARNRSVMALGAVASKRKQLDTGLVDDVVEMLRRSRVEREAFAAEWRRRTEQR